MTPTFIHPRISHTARESKFRSSCFFLCFLFRPFFIRPRGGSPVPLTTTVRGYSDAGTGTGCGFFLPSRARSLARLLASFSPSCSLSLSCSLSPSLSCSLPWLPFPIVFCCSAPNFLSVAMIFCFSYFLSVVFATKTLSWYFSGVVVFFFFFFFFAPKPCRKLLVSRTLRQSWNLQAELEHLVLVSTTISPAAVLFPFLFRFFFLFLIISCRTLLCGGHGSRLEKERKIEREDSFFWPSPGLLFRIVVVPLHVCVRVLSLM